MSRLYKFPIFLCVLAVICIKPAFAQSTEESESHSALKNIAMARELALKGYEAQEPVYLVSAALLLAEYPVKGPLMPDSIIVEQGVVLGTQSPVRQLPTDPQQLLTDARNMASADAGTLAMIDRASEKVRAMQGNDRGRKFSPLIQEFVLNATGNIKLWATFNAHEVAEVYVTGSGATTLDLYLYDAQGRLIASDTKNIDDCYVSFTPSEMLQFRIEIKNNGAADNRCLLMTN